MCIISCLSGGNSQDQSKEIKIVVGRFPLVHKLIEFADIRRDYAEI